MGEGREVKATETARRYEKIIRIDDQRKVKN